MYGRQGSKGVWYNMVWQADSVVWAGGAGRAGLCPRAIAETTTTEKNMFDVNPIDLLDENCHVHIIPFTAATVVAS